MGTSGIREPLDTTTSSETTKTSFLSQSTTFSTVSEDTSTKEPVSETSGTSQLLDMTSSETTTIVLSSQPSTFSTMETSTNINIVTDIIMTTRNRLGPRKFKYLNPSLLNRIIWSRHRGLQL